MDSLLRSTRKRFTLLLLVLISFTVLIIAGVLQIVNVRHIGSVANISEVHQVATDNQELAGYIASQKKFEAHFISLASAIKAEERDRLSTALGITALGVIAVGSVVAMIATRTLMKPVVEAYTSQERFLQDAAHELRNPLAALTIALQQYQNDQKSIKRLVDTFRRQTSRLVQINEDLLFLERKRQEKLSKVNLSDLILDVSEDVSIYANKKKIKLDIVTEPNIIKTIAVTDYVRVIKNLLDNAIKYSPDKSIITVRQSMKGGLIKVCLLYTSPSPRD